MTSPVTKNKRGGGKRIVKLKLIKPSPTQWQKIRGREENIEKNTTTSLLTSKPLTNKIRRPYIQHSQIHSHGHTQHLYFPQAQQAFLYILTHSHTHSQKHTPITTHHSQPHLQAHSQSSLPITLPWSHSAPTYP